MPYYCTVPRCTSMAGKAKNVSFHQFPRDAELAKLWNNILKRGKPYTKYSKVCSLHFKPEDYTITSAGKNKGQWRTLRKDAIPSQNLPSDTPAPYQRRQSGAWVPSMPIVGDQIHQQARQIAQAIYMQAMLAMQAAGVTDPSARSAMCNGLPPPPFEDPDPQPSTSPSPSSCEEPQTTDSHRRSPEPKQGNTSFKCDDCSKCFKDPDVFLIHKRSHKPEKENLDLNTLKPEMLKSNPILANLLKNTMEKNIFNPNFFEKQLLVSFSNVESYLRSVDDYDCDNKELSESLDSDKLVIDESVA